MNRKRVIGILLALTIVVAEFSGSAVQEVRAQQTSETVNIKKGKAKVKDIKPQKEFKDLSKKQQNKVDKAKEHSKKSAKDAGNYLNTLNRTSDTYKVAVKEVLDSYFSEKVVDEKKIKEFSDTLTSDISKQVENYVEARKERDNESNLPYAAGEEILIFDKDTSMEEIDTLVTHLSDSYEVLWDNTYTVDPTLSEDEQKRLKALEDYKGNILVKVNLDLDQTVAEAAEEFNSYECVIDAETNTKVDLIDPVVTDGLTSELNDPFIDAQWYLDRCNFLDAWNSNDCGCRGIEIAVIDTGCRITHKDLREQIVIEKAVDVTQTDAYGNYMRLNALAKPYDSDHGTLCAGIIAADSNNSEGIAGAAIGYFGMDRTGIEYHKSNCEIIPIKVSRGLKEDGSTLLCTSDICAGIIYAIESGAEVISMSISSSGNIQSYSEVAVKAEVAGVVMVTSAGNTNNTTKRYPAALDTVIGVGGTDEANQKASFSTYGSWIDIVAPATNYVSTITQSDTLYGLNKNGTSFATPLVASAVGLMLATNPTLTPAEIRSMLAETSTDLGLSDFNCGMLNAGLAVQAAKYENFATYSSPYNFQVTAKGNGIVNLSFNWYIYGPEFVEIHRSNNYNGTYKKIATLESNNYATYSYDDPNLTQGKVYFYKVRAGMKYGNDYKYTDFSYTIAARAQ